MSKMRCYSDDVHVVYIYARTLMDGPLTLVGEKMVVNSSQ